MSNLQTQNRKRSDIIDALEWFDSRPRGYKRQINDAVYEYGRDIRPDLNWHLGYTEHHSAVSSIERKIRVAVKGNRDEYIKPIIEGEWVRLNGTKLFAADRLATTKSPAWCYGRPTMPRRYQAVSGIEHPLIVEVINHAKSVQNALYYEDSPFMIMMARMTAKRRALALQNARANLDRNGIDMAVIDQERAEKLAISSKLNELEHSMQLRIENAIDQALNRRFAEAK